MIIYKITDTTNGFIYIGQTEKTIKHRWSAHKNDAACGSQTYLHRAIRKRGADCFVPEVLCECSPEEADMLEILCIAAFRSKSPYGYNATDGGKGVHGYEITPQVRSTLGSGLRGKKRPPFSPEWCANLSQANLGKTPWNKGVPMRESTKQIQAVLGSERAKNPDFIEKVSRSVKEAQAKPEVRAKMVAAFESRENWPEKMKERSANPNWISKQKEGSQKRSQSPEWKANHAKMVADPEYRRKLSEAGKKRAAREKAEKLAKTWTTPTFEVIFTNPQVL